MQPKPLKGIAARTGRWSARHRKTAILGWLAFILIAFGVGNALGPKQPAAADRFDGESKRAERVLDKAGFAAARGGEMVLIQSRDGTTVKDPAFKTTITEVVRAVSAKPIVANVKSPLAGGSVSEDGRSALVEFEIKGDPKKAADKIGPVTAAVKSVAARNPDLAVGQFGASTENELQDYFADEQAKEMQISMSSMMIILLITFGALVAASVPVLLAITSVIGTIGLTAVASQVVPQDMASMQAIILIGLAVGVDYSLFYVRREREERKAGRSRSDALDIAAATSGRAVLVSGLTVMTAMAGMFVTGNTTFVSMGLATMIVVAVAVIGSLTVLPAMLSLLGDRVEKGRVPFLGRRSEARDSRAWGWLVDRVLRRPVVALVLAGGALLALAVPGLGIETKLSGVEEMPSELASVQTYKKVQKAFPSEAGPVMVVVKADDVSAPRVKAAIADLQRRAEGDRQVTGPIGVEINPRHTVARLNVGLPGTGADDSSLRGLEHLREDLLPATLGRVPGVSADVTGPAAYTADFNALMKSRTPLVFVFVLGLAFVLMLVSFRSIVVPIKAIVLNLLSVGASYGMLKLVFQDGHGEQLLGFESNGGITTYLPLFLFVILFGLSMDYHVFILSRVREAWQNGMSSDEAVAHGIKSTAGTVTSAALIMVAVFAAMATGSTIDAKEMGIGLAFAVLIDATVIRGVLLPASMKLLGERNWYLPRWLEWLPKLEGETPAPARPAAPVHTPAPQQEREPAMA